MNDLTDTLAGLQATDTATAKLVDLAKGNAQDGILRINLEALAKRRRDLEGRLGALLGSKQLDLVEYRIETVAGGACPAVAVGRALEHFQEMTTAIFDAIRSSPKRRYQPSTDSIDQSTMVVAAARTGPLTISLSIPNERLIAVRSDLDMAFDLVFALFRLRTQDELVSLYGRVGTAALSQASAWAANCVEHGLITFISWRKSAKVSESLAVSQEDALALLRMIEGTHLEEAADYELDCELLGLNNAASSFLLRLATGEEIVGRLADDFSRGAWPVRRPYIGTLTRTVTVHCSTGDETVLWTLNALVPRT